MKHLLNFFRKTVTGKDDKFIFFKCQKPLFDSSSIHDIYIHIPFCRNKCTYCPYCTTPFDKSKLDEFFKCLNLELDLYKENFVGKVVDSVYIGGGTPTLAIEQIGALLDKIRELCKVRYVAIETNPEEISEEILIKLEKFGIDRLNVGVQSFDAATLKTLGRSYTPKILYEKLNILKNFNFKCINIDIIFAINKNDHKRFLCDIQKALSYNFNQITAYPLFKFSYGKSNNKSEYVKMPNLRIRKIQYDMFCNECKAVSLKPVSVWGYAKDANTPFSSVSRRHFIGLGPSAASHTKGAFYFNTFSIDAYIKSLQNNKPATSLKMKMSDKLENLYDLYWAIYETTIPNATLAKFKNSKSFKFAFLISIFFGFAKKTSEGLSLSKRGMFWIHLLQNQYILNYINKVWGESLKKQYPERIVLDL